MKKEEAFYVIVWIGGIFWGLLRFTDSSRNHHIISPDDFEKGYTFLNRMKDNSDAEWTMLTSLFKRYWFLICLEVLGCQFVLRTKPKVLPICYAFYSVFCLVVILGIAATSVFLSLIVIIYLVSCYGRKLPCYILTISALLLLQNQKFAILKAHFLDTSGDTFLFDVVLAWLLAKCLSFSVDRIEAHVHKCNSYTDFATIVAYSLYLPTIFSGPIIAYDKFCKQMLINSHLSSQEFLLRIRHLLYFITWYFIYEILLHFVFSSAIQFYPEIVSQYDSSSLCGLGYSLSVMFYLKYFVIYGISGSFAQLEGLSLPPPPKCISCVHLSSFLSRHFDRGLYLWLLKYLYRPIINGNYNSLMKIFAVCVCFSFVCLWHGLEKQICIWSALNCLLLLSEISMQFILTRTSIGKTFEKIPFVFQKRLKAAVATPHFIMMCISCSFFLSNWEIGILLIKKILLGGLIPLVPFSFIMYCGCHVSMNLKQWQEKNVYL